MRRLPPSRPPVHPLTHSARPVGVPVRAVQCVFARRSVGLLVGPSGMPQPSRCPTVSFLLRGREGCTVFSKGDGDDKWDDVKVRTFLGIYVGRKPSEREHRIDHTQREQACSLISPTRALLPCRRCVHCICVSACVYRWCQLGKIDIASWATDGSSLASVGSNREVSIIRVRTTPHHTAPHGTHTQQHQRQENRADTTHANGFIGSLCTHTCVSSIGRSAPVVGYG